MSFDLQDDKLRRTAGYLDTLGTCYYIYGGLICAGGLLFLLIALGIGGSALGLAPKNGGGGEIFAFGLMGVIFFGVFALTEVFGYLTILAGTRLKEHRSKTFCIVMAAITSTNVPVGTALGVFTFIVMLSREGEILFAENEPPTLS